MNTSHGYIFQELLTKMFVVLHSWDTKCVAWKDPKLEQLCLPDQSDLAGFGQGSECPDGPKTTAHPSERPTSVASNPRNFQLFAAFWSAQSESVIHVCLTNSGTQALQWVGRLLVPAKHKAALISRYCQEFVQNPAEHSAPTSLLHPSLHPSSRSAPQTRRVGPAAAATGGAGERHSGGAQRLSGRAAAAGTAHPALRRMGLKKRWVGGGKRGPLCDV